MTGAKAPVVVEGEEEEKVGEGDTRRSSCEM